MPQFDFLILNIQLNNLNSFWYSYIIYTKYFFMTIIFVLKYNVHLYISFCLNLGISLLGISYLINTFSNLITLNMLHINLMTSYVSTQIHLYLNS